MDRPSPAKPRLGLGLLWLTTGLAAGWAASLIAGTRIHSSTGWIAANTAIVGIALAIALRRKKDIGIGMLIGWATMTVALPLLAGG